MVGDLAASMAVFTSFSMEAVDRLEERGSVVEVQASQSEVRDSNSPDWIWQSVSYIDGGICAR